MKKKKWADSLERCYHHFINEAVESQGNFLIWPRLLRTWKESPVSHPALWVGIVSGTQVLCRLPRFRKSCWAPSGDGIWRRGASVLLDTKKNTQQAAVPMFMSLTSTVSRRVSPLHRGVNPCTEDQGDLCTFQFGNNEKFSAKSAGSQFLHVNLFTSLLFSLSFLASYTYWVNTSGEQLIASRVPLQVDAASST